MLVAGYDPEKPTDIKWVKIFTWRGNGDGINPFNNALIEDCFIRTQDDSTYVNGRGIRRVGSDLLRIVFFNLKYNCIYDWHITYYTHMVNEIIYILCNHFLQFTGMTAMDQHLFYLQLDQIA